jgi:hypothetical protein
VGRTAGESDGPGVEVGDKEPEGEIEVDVDVPGEL